MSLFIVRSMPNIRKFLINDNTPTDRLDIGKVGQI